MDHMLEKFEPNRIVRNVQNFELFDKNLNFFNTILDKNVDAILKEFLLLKQVFYGKILIFRLLSFGVPKFMVLRHVKPGQMFHQTWQT